MSMTDEERKDWEESTFFKAGAEAARNKIPITKTAIRNIRFGCKQYDQFVDGYDSIKAKKQNKS